MNANMNMNVNVENNESVEACKKCGGRCCKRNPGICHPRDFEDNWGNMVKAIECGKYTIDSWDDDWGDNDIYYIRPMVKGREYEMPHYSHGGECIFLADNGNGCELKFEDRPLGCRMLTVGTKVENKYKCVSLFDNYEYAEQWISYQDKLKEYIKKYEHRR